MKIVIVLIIVLLIALAAIIAALMILRTMNSSSKNVDIHMSGGADLKRGFVSYDNNYFKGVSGELVKTTVLGQDMRNKSYEGRTVTLVNQTTSHQYQLSLEPEIILGRTTVDGVFTVKDASISKKHCRIFEYNGFVFLEDLQSMNHTYLNDVKVKSSVPVNSGDTIRLGNTVFVIYY